MPPSPCLWISWSSLCVLLQTEWKWRSDSLDGDASSNRRLPCPNRSKRTLSHSWDSPWVFLEEHRFDWERFPASCYRSWMCPHSHSPTVLLSECERRWRRDVDGRYYSSLEWHFWLPYWVWEGFWGSCVDTPPMSRWQSWFRSRWGVCDCVHCRCNERVIEHPSSLNPHSDSSRCRWCHWW